jgi:SAM-dependent MidA family methyltransferase
MYASIMEIIRFNIPEISPYKYLPAMMFLFLIGKIPYIFSQLFFSIIENVNPLKDTQKNIIKITGIIGWVNSPSSIDIKYIIIILE